MQASQQRINNVKSTKMLRYSRVTKTLDTKTNPHLRVLKKGNNCVRDLWPVAEPSQKEKKREEVVDRRREKQNVIIARGL